MCTLVLLRRPGHPWPLILAANRDEMANRPWQPPARHWPDHPGVVAGRDQEAGGSWLGLNDRGMAAAVLNRVGSLGPAPGKRSRGELILRALDAPSVEAAVSVICDLDPRDYRSLNLVVADYTRAYWLRHEDAPADARAPSIKASRVGSGITMVTAHNLNDRSSPRIAGYLPRFAAAPAPDPEGGDWRAWEALLASRETADPEDPGSAMTIVTDHGFETTSSSLIALPAASGAPRRAIWRFAAGRPDRSAYRELNIE